MTTKTATCTTGLTRTALAAVCAAVLVAAITTAHASYQQNFKALYQQGSYDQAVDLLESHLEGEPGDAEARTDLALTLLRMGQRDYAREQIDKLLNAGTTAARRTGESLNGLFEKLVRQDQDRERLSAALAELDGIGARRQIETMALSTEQKAIVRMYLEIYTGDYAAARAALETLHPERLSERKRVQELRHEVDAAEARFGELMAKVDAFLYSGDSVSTFGNAMAASVPALKEFSVPKYMEAFTSLAEHAPLNPRVMDLSFHAALLATPQDDLFALGEKILARKGSIRIPCFSRNLYFDLVIDAAAGRLRTESVAKPFVATYTKRGNSQPANDWYLDLVPFDVAFSQMGEIGQDVKHNFNIQGLDDGGQALKLKSGGIVPAYALMPALHMFYGEKAQRKATFNLGQFIVTTAQRSGATVKAKLINPEKTTVQKSMVFMAVMSGLASGAGSMAAQNGDFNSAMQLQQTSSRFNALIASNLVQNEMLAANQTAWHAQLARRGFDFVRQYDFDDVESLLAGE